MKKLILTLCFFSTLSMSGTLTLRNNNPAHILYDCVIDYQILSDYFNNVYEMTCIETPDTYVQQSIYSKSRFIINGNITLTCPVYYSEIADNDNFNITVDCRDDELFNSGFN